MPPAGARQSTRVLPDGCVDLISRGGELLIAGPDLGAFESRPIAGQTIVGLRLRPGVAGSVLGIPASELRDTRVAIDEVWARRGPGLADAVAEAGPPALRRRALEDLLLARLRDAGEPDRLVLAAADWLGRPGTRVSALGGLLGIGERQLRRRFDGAVGYGPKVLDRVLRFQRLVAAAPAIAAGDDALARVAAELGYADQAHLTRECKRLSGLTPARLADAWAPAKKARWAT